MLQKTLITIFLILTILPVCAESHESFFDYPEYRRAKLSPDGKHIAVSFLSGGKAAIAFLNRESKKIVGSAKFKGSDEVGNFQWVSNSRVVIDIVKKVHGYEQLQFQGELYAVNYDGSKAEKIYGHSAGSAPNSRYMKKKESIRGWGNVVDPLLNDEKHILISSTPMSKTGERHAQLLKVDVYTGIVRKKIDSAPVSFSKFILNTDGNAIAVTGKDKDNNNALFVKKNKQWQRVSDTVVGTKVNVITADKTGEYIYTVDDFEHDKKGLYKLKISDLTYKHIFTDKKVNITNVETSIDTSEVYAVELNDGYPSYAFLNSKLDESKVFKNIIKSLPYSRVTLTSKSTDGRYYIVLASSDTNAGTLYFYDKSENKLEFLFKYHSKFNDNDFVQVEPIIIPTKDNYSLPGYFTPAKQQGTNRLAPAVVLVHGGPHGPRDHWEFSAQVQYLAAKGFSVIQVNFRGSGGYGANHEFAGHRNWGQLIQEDILAGYQWLVDNKKASADNVCIMGASFGGYSAIQSLTKYSDTYQCAIANAGIYDLELMFEEGDIQERIAGLSYLKKVLGENKQQLRANSPVHHVGKIKAPILLAHGKKDIRAPYEHALRLRDALDKENKPYEWHVVGKEAHGFYNPNNQKAYMKKVVNFLNTHLSH